MLVRTASEDVSIPVIMTVHRRAFTLFEVAIAMALVSIAVTTVLVLFPAGIKAQQHARFRVLASAKMLELVDMFNTANDGNPSMDHEGMDPWDVPMAYRSRSFDLESLVPSHRSGVAPLPLTIARRLDSDGDEIQKLLDEGGYLYYALPHITGNFDERALPSAPSNEQQRLVFGVTGFAQENGLYSLPWKSWPYYIPYPSPPYHAHHEGDWLPSPPANATKFGAPEMGSNAKPIEVYLWEATQDPDVQIVMQWPETPDPDISKNYGYLPYAYPSASPTAYALYPTGTRLDRYPPTKEGAIRYVQAALLYCQRKGLGSAFFQPTGALTPSSDPAVAAVEVRAARFMAHAATCLTRWFDKGLLDAGVVIPTATIGADTTPTATYTHDVIVALHDNSLRLCDHYCASFPYDWGGPRPIERAIMTDHPLIQWDVFSTPVPGTVFGDGRAAAQWKPIAGTRVTNMGRSVSFPGKPLDGVWGDGDNRHFSLAAPFAPDERCRQVVFWAVDWQSYDDFETAPSAPLDASRYLKGAPEKNADLAAMMRNHDWVDSEIWNYRNPEKPILFFDQGVPALAAKTDVKPWILGVSGNEQDRGLGDPNDRNSPQWVFGGHHGADRNFNRLLDRGPLPTSSRMRAATIARFNYYDGRVHQCLR